MSAYVCFADECGGAGEERFGSLSELQEHVARVHCGRFALFRCALCCPVAAGGDGFSCVALPVGFVAAAVALLWRA